MSSPSAIALAGLMSRWRTPARCAAARPRARPMPIASTRAPAAPAFAMRSRLSPRARSDTRYSCSPSSPTRYTVTTFGSATAARSRAPRCRNRSRAWPSSRTFVTSLSATSRSSSVSRASQTSPQFSRRGRAAARAGTPRAAASPATCAGPRRRPRCTPRSTCAGSRASAATSAKHALARLEVLLEERPERRRVHRAADQRGNLGHLGALHRPRHSMVYTCFLARSGVDDGELAALWRTARAAWPAIDVDLAIFTAYARARAEALEPAHAGDLCITCACMRIRPRARARDVRARHARRDRSAPAPRRSGGGVRRRGVRQLCVAEKLLLGDAPKLAEYAGRGPLGACGCASSPCAPR